MMARLVNIFRDKDRMETVEEYKDEEGKGYEKRIPDSLTEEIEADCWKTGPIATPVPEGFGRAVYPGHSPFSRGGFGTGGSVTSMSPEEMKLLGKTAKQWQAIEKDNVELKNKVQELEKFIEDKMEQLMESVKDEQT